MAKTLDDRYQSVKGWATSRVRRRWTTAARHGAQGNLLEWPPAARGTPEKLVDTQHAADTRRGGQAQG